MTILRLSDTEPFGTLMRGFLQEAEAKAALLFARIKSGGFIRSGITEKQLNQEVYALAHELFGIKKYWHKRIVRAGPNTLCPYKENPPDLEIQPSDILFFDFGPVFEEWEADFGRTYVLGSDPDKLRMKSDVENAWYEGKAYFDAHPDILANELFAFVNKLAQDRGWTFGQRHCGHLIENFPHEKIYGDGFENYIHPDNHIKLRPRDWILEVHFVDLDQKIGGFFEQLLTGA